MLQSGRSEKIAITKKEMEVGERGTISKCLGYQDKAGAGTWRM